MITVVKKIVCILASAFAKYTYFFTQNVTINHEVA
jgi:hypothetical protein